MRISVVITGVGLMAATYALTKKITELRPDFLLQAGVAGCLDPSWELGAAVLIQHETVGDLGVTEQGRFRPLSELNLQDPNQFPWKDGRLKNPYSQLHQLGLPVVDGVTVNQVSTESIILDHYRSLGAVAESMEGAALHYVGLQEQIPFLQVRTFSNLAGERDKSKWKLEAAINNLQQILSELIPKLSRS